MLTLFSTILLQAKGISDPFAGEIVTQAEQAQTDVTSLVQTWLGFLYCAALVFSLWKMIYGDARTGTKIGITASIIAGLIEACIQVLK